MTGKVLVEDLTIDGLHPGDRPFFSARQIAVALDWVPAFSRRPDITISSVEMTDWQMLVEKWDGAHNFPRFSHDDGKPPGPKRLTTTLKHLRAFRGQFAFEDHETPWSVTCPNLDIDITNLPNYHGTATFTGGTVAIQDFVPMWANMKAEFVIDGSRIHLDRIDMNTDGATTIASGDVDMGHWPNQGYQVKSRVNFPRMRELFFKDEPWRLAGAGDFTGTFRLFKTGEETNRDLTGTFTSELAGLNDYRFPRLYGSLRWTQHGFDVWNAGSQFYGGDARFVYGIKPFGEKTKPTHRFDATLTGVDLARFTDFEQFPGLRFAGSASLHNLLEWPSGRFAEHRGEGQLSITPPPGVAPMTASLAEARAADPNHSRHEWGPFAPLPLPAHLPIAAELSYRYGPEEVTIDNGRFATERTYVTFGGTTAYRRAVAAAVPRHQQRLAGERSGPGRHHQRLRIADRRGAVCGARRVRWGDDRRLPGAARRGAVHRRGSARLRHAVGRRLRPDHRREPLRDRQGRRGARRRFGDPRRRIVLARLSARGRRRGDQRAHPRRAARSRQPASRLRHRRVSGVGAAVGRVSPDRRLPASGRIRGDDD